MKVKGKAKVLRRIFKEASAILIWAFLFTKFFIFDIDVYLANVVSQECVFLLKYKFFFILGIFLLLWQCLGSRRFLLWLIFVLASPFYIVFWRVPQLLLRSKSWIVIVSYLSAIISFLKSLKVNLALYGIILLSILLIITQEQKHILIACMIFLSGSLFWHFTKRFKNSFKSPSMFGFNATTMKDIAQKAHTVYKIEEIKEIKKSDITEAEHKKLMLKLENILLFDRLWYFVASKLRDFKKSKILIAFCFGKLFYTMVITVIVFALLNYTTYKISPNSFVIPQNSTGIFSFLYYSFNTIFTNSLADFYPIGAFARLLNSAEIFSGFMIVVILFFVITTVVKEKHTEELDGMIEVAKIHGQELDIIIRDEYKLTIDDAIKEVEKIKGSMLKLIYYFTSQIDG